MKGAITRSSGKGTGTGKGSGTLHDPNTSHALADNKKDSPRVPQPQRNIKTHKEIGTKPKTSATPTA